MCMQRCNRNQFCCYFGGYFLNSSLYFCLGHQIKTWFVNKPLSLIVEGCLIFVELLIRCEENILYVFERLWCKLVFFLLFILGFLGNKHKLHLCITLFLGSINTCNLCFKMNVWLVLKTTLKIKLQKIVLG